MYILQYSCLMTLAHEHRRTLPVTIKRMGVFPLVEYQLADGEKRAVKFWRPPNWRVPFSTSNPPEDIEVVLAKVMRFTRSRLDYPCAACGSPERIEMHHIRHLRKGSKTITSGFSKIMSAINRKQVPLCDSCHDKVHAGEYES